MTDPLLHWVGVSSLARGHEPAYDRGTDSLAPTRRVFCVYRSPSEFLLAQAMAPTVRATQFLALVAALSALLGKDPAGKHAIQVPVAFLGSMLAFTVLIIQRVLTQRCERVLVSTRACWLAPLHDTCLQALSPPLYTAGCTQADNIL